MAGLGIQQSINDILDTGTNSISAHELFMSRFNEYYKAEAEVNSKLSNMSQDITGNMRQHKTPRVKSLKDRLNATTFYTNETKELQEISKSLDNKFDAMAAKKKADEARKKKLKEKAEARAHRPQPSTPDEVMKGVLNYHGNE